MIQVDVPHPGIVVELVSTLYQKYEELNVPQFYVNGGENPFKGLVDIIPRKARFYAIAIGTDLFEVAEARFIMKRMAMRRKVKEVVTDKDTVKLNRFTMPGNVIVLFA